MCRPAAVLHGRLFALAQSVRSFARAFVATPFQSVPLLPRRNIKMLLALAVLIWKTKTLAQGEFDPSLPRSSPPSLPPPSSSSPASCRRSLTVPQFGLWWRLPPCVEIPIEHWCSAAAASKRRADRRCQSLTHHVRPNSAAMPKPRGHTKQREGITP